MSGDPLGLKCDFDPSDPPKNLIITYGAEIKRALEAKDMLAGMGVECGVILVERIRPRTAILDYLAGVSAGRHIVFAEEGVKTGGLASTALSELAAGGHLADCCFEIAAIEDSFASPDTPSDIFDYVGLSARALASRFVGEV